MTAQGFVDPDLYRRTLPPILDDEGFGSVVLGIILTDSKTTQLKLAPIVGAIEALKPRKPLIFAALDEGAPFDFPELEQLRGLGVACFPSAERALRAVAYVTSRAALGDTPQTNEPVSLSISPLSAGVLTEWEGKRILVQVGICIPEGRLVRELQEALRAASEIGYPVVLKAQSSNLPHKSDVGGVVLGIQSEADLSEGWSTLHRSVLRARPGLILQGVLVERMSGKGLELIVGARHDPQWGPVLMAGLGGVLAEALGDVVLLAPDLPKEVIEGALDRLRCSVLFHGFRGSPALDVSAVADVLRSIGQLMRSLPEIRELDINPLVVYEKGKGVVALDALISVSLHRPNRFGGPSWQSERIGLLRVLDRDPAKLGELVDCRSAAEPPVAASLGAAERHLRLVVHRGTVDVADSRLHPLGDLQCAQHVAPEHSRRQPVLGGVRDAHRFVDALDANDAQHGAERLLAVESHLGCHFVEHGRGDHCALPRPACHELGTRADCLFDHSLRHARQPPDRPSTPATTCRADRRQAATMPWRPTSVRTRRRPTRRRSPARSTCRSGPGWRRRRTRPR